MFLEDYAKGLLDVEDALDESRGDAWDYTLDPISLDVSPLPSQFFRRRRGRPMTHTGVVRNSFSAGGP